jgi:DNA-binding MarR family transcriptional regulator
MSSATRGLYLPPAVLSLADLSWPAKLVLAEILDLHNSNARVQETDQHFISRLPGVAPRTVQAAIKELVEAGYVVRETNQRADPKRVLTPVLGELGIAGYGRPMRGKNDTSFLL